MIGEENPFTRAAAAGQYVSARFNTCWADSLDGVVASIPTSGSTRGAVAQRGKEFVLALCFQRKWNKQFTFSHGTREWKHCSRHRAKQTLPCFCFGHQQIKASMPFHTKPYHATSMSAQFLGYADCPWCLFFNLCFWMLETTHVPARVHCHTKPPLLHASHSMINSFIYVCVAKAQHAAMSRAEHFFFPCSACPFPERSGRRREGGRIENDKRYCTVTKTTGSAPMAMWQCTPKR